MIVKDLTSKQSIKLKYEGEEGVIVTNIQKEGPASKAGLNKGDLIIEVQHKPVTSVDGFHQAILKTQQEEDILMFIKRQDKTSKFIVLKQKKDV